MDKLKEMVTEGPNTSIMQLALRKMGKNPEGKRFTFTVQDLEEFTAVILHYGNITVKLVTGVGILVLVGVVSFSIAMLFGATMFLNFVGLNISIWQVFAAIAVSVIGFKILSRFFR